jgi:RNA polymerase sigma-70 factor (ECF subfamily)
LIERSPGGRAPRRLDECECVATPGNALARTGRARGHRVRLIGWLTGEDKVREFETVALVHLDALFRSALRLTQNRAEAEDIVQDTWLCAFRSFHRFDPGTNCRAWLFTILRNAFLTRRRRVNQEAVGESAVSEDAWQSATDPDAPIRHPEDALLRSVVHGDVDRALRELPLAHREIVILADLEGLTYREIAQVVGCPIGTVMSRFSRGRAQLRGRLGRLAREHGYAKEPE